jgi:hypothetical protein
VGLGAVGADGGEARRRPRPRVRSVAGDGRHELLGPEFELEFEEGELRLTAASGEELWRLFTSYDGAAKAQVDSLAPQRAEEYRRAYIAHHERYRANGRISLPRRYLVTLGRRRGRSGEKRGEACLIAGTIPFALSTRSSTSVRAVATRLASDSASTSPHRSWCDPRRWAITWST